MYHHEKLLKYKYVLLKLHFRIVLVKRSLTVEVLQLFSLGKVDILEPSIFMMVLVLRSQF